MVTVSSFDKPAWQGISNADLHWRTTQILALGVLITMTISPLCRGRTTRPAPDGDGPASSIVSLAEYSWIHSDIQVPFRFKAPDAQEWRTNLYHFVQHIFR